LRTEESWVAKTASGWDVHWVTMRAIVTGRQKESGWVADLAKKTESKKEKTMALRSVACSGTPRARLMGWRSGPMTVFATAPTKAWSTDPY
jgi:hypothetical protein